MRIKNLAAALPGAPVSIAPARSSFAAEAAISDNVIKIGVLNDRSGLYADLSGTGSVVAAQMAAEEFGNSIAGTPIEIVSAPLLSFHTANDPNRLAAPSRVVSRASAAASAHAIHSAKLFPVQAFPVPLAIKRLRFHLGDNIANLIGRVPIVRKAHRASISRI